jgi:hypothetical protein
VVKVNMKESVEEGPMMASTELFEAWVSSDKADSANNANGGYLGYFRVIRVGLGLPELY